MINVLILGAASQISRFLIPDLLADKTVNLTLFARQAPQRLGQYAGESRVTLVDGDWNQEADIEQVMPNQDIVFLASSSLVGNQNVVTAMKHTGVQRLIVAGGLGIDDEVAGKFGNWNARMMGDYTPYKQRLEYHLSSHDMVIRRKRQRKVSNRARRPAIARNSGNTSSSGEVSDCHRETP